MIPINDKMLEGKTNDELRRIKKINIIAACLFGLLVVVLLVMYFKDRELPSLVLSVICSYLPILHFLNIQKINKAMKK